MNKSKARARSLRPAQAPPVAPSMAFYIPAVVCTLSATALACVFPVQSDDIFMYLAIGRRFFAEGRLPQIDPFLFSLPNYHWHVSHEWISHLIAYGLFQVGGWSALIFAKTLLILATASVPVWMARRLGVRSVLTPLVIALAAVAGAHRFIERSSLVSDLFTAAVLAIILKERASPGRLLSLLPPLFLAWVNLHPGFFVGLAICGLALLTRLNRWSERSTRILALWVGLSVLALLATPAGVAGVFYPLRPLFDRSWDVYREHNYEWMPTFTPPYRDSIHALAFVALTGINLFLLMLNLRRGPWFEGIMFVVLVWLGLSAARFLSTSAWALAVLAPGLFASIRRDVMPAPGMTLRRVGTMANAALAFAGLAFCVKVAISGYDTLAGPRHPGLGLDPALHPIAAADFIDRIDLRTPLFNQHEFGCYLAWRWNGNRKLFYHGFVDDLVFYDRDYFGVTRSREDFDRIVQQYHVGAFLLDRLRAPPDSAPLIYQILLSDRQWRLVYSDALSMLFLRDIPENRAALEKVASRG